MSLKKITKKILFESPSVLSGEDTEIKKLDFEFQKKLGHGAFGNVWKVRHKVTQELYAIKQVSKENVIKMPSQFRREVYIMYNLDHPHIAKLYNHFEDDRAFYLIMEYCENGNLFQRLQKQKQFMEVQACKYFCEVLLAIQYLHSHVPAIIHRDIKPENILLDKNDKVKLTDFGWSNYYGSDVEPRKTVCGTPEYLPPEMVENKTHDTSADIWCLGVLLYEMLTGHTPFRSKINDVMRENISKCKPKFPLSFPTQAKDLISKLLIKPAYERLTIKEILNHPWVTSLNDLKKVTASAHLIFIPQLNETTPVVFKSYKVIGEVKKEENYKDLMETQSTHTNNDLNVLCNPEALSSGKSSSEHKSHSSYFTLSDSELVLSESDASKDMMEDTAFRESLKLIEDSIEQKKTSIKLTKIINNVKDHELETESRHLDELQDHVSSIKLQLSSMSCAEDQIKAQIKTIDSEIDSIFILDNKEDLKKKISDLKKKITITSRTLEITKKSLINIKHNSDANINILEEKQKELVALKDSLLALKNGNRTDCDLNRLQGLKNYKETLEAQVPTEQEIFRKIIQDMQKRLENKMNALEDQQVECPSRTNGSLHPAGLSLEDQIWNFISEANQKCYKIESKIETLPKKFQKKQIAILETFKLSKEAIEINSKVLSDSKYKVFSLQNKEIKDALKLELQNQKINQSKYNINQIEHEKSYYMYQVINK
jgi:serine/threonine protein kinase